MSVEEDSAEWPDPAMKVCPMCGGKNGPRAYRCTDCGEELRDLGKPIPSMLSQLPDESVTLAAQIRALSAMYAALGIGSLVLMSLYLIELSGQAALIEYGLILLLGLMGMGILSVSVGVARRSMATVRIGMLVCTVFAAGMTLTCYLSPLALFLVPGILQSRRILQLHEKIAHAAEEDWDAGASNE